MCKELVNYLNLNKGGTVLDCTVGSGGHAEAILKRIGSGGRLIGIDQDRDALDLTKNRLLKRFKNCTLVQANFRNMDTILVELSIDVLDGIIFDLGVSSLQLDSAARGFSIRLDAPLDMRMDSNLKLSAFDLVNFLPEENISDILKNYGQERWHKRIARAIVRERKKSIIVSTRQLVDLVRRVIPYRYARIHPATRTFQALRIAVNDELTALREGLNKCVGYLKKGARVCVISFHSMEDRIVKRKFRDLAKEEIFQLITKKPIRPTEEETKTNPRVRSAKMRVAEKI
ncbi:MAG: 16S rRNA (cytosine(1402)-N(4))-methyltransferase RsmH [Omnitrophica bacterium]|nr:16S rRNA (cytosine(1402)-N(4))-methyltransferase RsmH [Candidatus Omnitrophota bacterium]